jgi:O-antigen/teichoic acid export membrane protein
MIAILGCQMFGLELLNLFCALYRSQRRMEIETAFRLVQSVTLIVLVLGVTTSARPSILNISVAFAGATLTTLVIVAAVFLRRNWFSERIWFDRGIWWRFLIMGWYFALAKGLGDATINMDSVLLGSWGKLTELGWYSAASRITRFMQLPMGLVATAIFPTLIVVLRESRKEFERYWLAWFKATAIFSFLLLFGTWAVADHMISLIYSPAFLPAAAVIRVLIVATVLVHFNVLYLHLLMAFDKEKRIFGVMLCSLLVNLGLNVLLIPRYGFRGAAVAAVLTHLSILVQYVYVCHKLPFVVTFLPSLGRVLASCILSGGIMYGITRLCEGGGIPWIISLATGVCSYAAGTALGVWLPTRDAGKDVAALP